MFTGGWSGRLHSARTGNALLVLNRFKFLFQVPANIRAHLAKVDYDRVS